MRSWRREGEQGEGLGCYCGEPTPPPPQLLQASPVDADETMEDKDGCIFSQCFFWYVPDRSLCLFAE